MGVILRVSLGPVKITSGPDSHRPRELFLVGGEHARYFGKPKANIRHPLNRFRGSNGLAGFQAQYFLGEFRWKIAVGYTN